MSRWTMPVVFVLALLVALGCMDNQEDPAAGRDDRDRMDRNDKMSMKKVDSGKVDQAIASWPEVSKKAVMMTMEKYGPPNELTATHAVWWKNGPWKYTKISNMPVDHHFPMRHQDVMEQAIDYRIPPDKFDELAAYDGSVIVERTKGEISARCDKEAANFLALNLAHEIVTGKRSVEDARSEYANQVKMMMNKQPAPLTERLMFSPMTGKSADPDLPAGQ